MNRFPAMQFCSSQSIRSLAAGALALALGLSVGVESAQATAYNWTNSAGGFWSDTLSWNPHGVPGPSDTASFTTRGTYTVTFTNSAIVSNLDVNVHSSSNLVLTLNLNGNSLSLIKPGSSSPTAFFVGGSSSGNDTLYLSSSTGVGQGLFVTNAVSQRTTIGDDTTGTMIVTNGFVQIGAIGVSGNQLVLGNNSASSSQGTLVLSGSTVSWSNNAAVIIGNNSASSANSLIISNSALMTCVGASLSVGGAGSSGNSLLLDSGGQLFVTAVGANIGTGSGSGNSATVQNGAIWDLGNTPLSIGSNGVDNSVTIGVNGTVSNAMTVTVAPGNSLILAGGELETALGVTNNAGTVAGFGTVIGEAIFTGTGTLTPGSGNTIGMIVASNDLTLASNTTTIIKLDTTQAGSNDLLAIAGTLTEAGTLTINNVGPALVGGDVFQMFSAGTFSGNFAATNLPPLSGGLSWDTSQLGSAGIISIPLVLSMTGPTNQIFNVGDTVTISATVTGVPAPSLQWQYNGSDLSDGPTTNGGSSIVGSLTSTLTISSAQPGDAGQYCLIASNIGAAQTNCMMLSLAGHVPPTIIGPSNQSVLQGDAATFSASVSGEPAPAIQWQQNGVNIPGATGATLVLTNVQPVQNGYIYSIIASNAYGEATNSAILQVNAPWYATPPALPVIPSNTFYITNYGAYGDGVSNNAAAIQSAINAAGAAGGGTVIVSAVGILTNYLSGPINLTNNVSLQINGGAMLQALPMSSWPNVNTAFITATNVHDVEISGSGTIDGQGAAWWPGGGTRPPLVQMALCTRVLIQTVTAQNPPFYHFRLIGGNTNVTVQGITINSPTNSPNTDGVDISGTNTLIQNCWIQDGDDDICIKNDTGLPTANIIVSNCTFNGGHGISVGSDTAGGVQNFIVNDCTYNGTIYGIRLKSDNAASGSGAGGVVQNLLYSNLTMTNVQYPIIIYSYYNEVGTPDEIDPATAAGEEVDPTNNCVVWRNITIANVTATGLTGKHISGIIWGRLEMPAMDITLTNVNITDPTNTFCVYNARGVRIIDSNLGDPNKTTNTFTVFNADITVTNSAANTNLVTLTGLVEPGTNNTMAFFNGVATIGSTNLLASNQTLTLGGSTLTVSNALNLSASTLNFAVGTNATKIAATGNLTLGGTLNVTDGGGLTSGTYTLLTYGGTLTYNGLSIGPASNPNFTYTVSTSTHGQVNLVVSNSVAAPVGGFTANPLSGAAPLSVTFMDTSTGSPTSWYWTFGDGGMSSSENPAHPYLNPGTYTAQLIASNTGGASSPVTQTIGVYDPYQWWRLQYFQNTNSVSGAPNADPYGKGISNTNQFLLGLNPTNPASVFRILSVVPQNNDVVITWAAGGGPTNVVQATGGDVNGGYATNFTDISGPIAIPGSGDTTDNYRDVGGATNHPSRYYRIRLGP
jgi:polygalacturonase/PKD repeat protein